MEKQPQNSIAIKVIIPAAGYGRRVGSPNAKEVMLFQGEPMIERALRACALRQLSVHLLTRQEKVALTSYIDRRDCQDGLELEVQLIEATSEWPETILRSQAHWATWNILILPDLVYSPDSVLDTLLEKIAKIEPAVLFAGRVVNSPESWGCVRLNQGGYEIVEKPNAGQEMARTGLWAWGLICFHKDFGRELFSALLVSNRDHQWKKIHAEVYLIELEAMEDITRTKR